MKKQYKYSRYNIITPIFNNKRIIFNMLTEKLILIHDETIYQDIINQIIPKTEKNFNMLLEGGVIVGDFIDERMMLLDENTNDSINRKTLSFTVFPSSNCQLGCVYCGQDHKKDSLSESMHDGILAKLEEMIMGKNHLNIGWFGGEPLLGISNITKLTPRFKELARKYNCTYGARMTSNGLLLNQRNIKLLFDNGISDLTVSIDGTKESHDARRPTKGGEGTYNVILKNLTSLFKYLRENEIECSLKLRINIDRYNKDCIEELFKDLENAGCKGVVSGWDIAPIHSWGNDAHERSLTFEEFGELRMDLTICLLEMGLLEKVPFPSRVRVLCQAITEDSLYLDANGNIYDCSETPLVPVHKEKFKLGTLSSSIKELYQNRNYNKWNEELKNNEYECGECNLLPVCGGGCPKAWKENFKPCPFYKYNFEEYLILGYLSSLHNLSQ
jgi:uncharacterized protein